MRNDIFNKNLLTKSICFIIIPLLFGGLASEWFNFTKNALIQEKFYPVLIETFFHNLILACFVIILTDKIGSFIIGVNAFYLGMALVAYFQIEKGLLFEKIGHLPTELFAWYLSIVAGYYFRKKIFDKESSQTLFRVCVLLVIFLAVSALIEAGIIVKGGV